MILTKLLLLACVCALLQACSLMNTKNIVSDGGTVEELNGLVAIEAEAFYKQSNTDIRKWYITSADNIPQSPGDADGPHLEGASADSYVEALPDTRHSHDDLMVNGENFVDQPGASATLHYKVKFNTAGRYYIWIRAYSSNSEDDAVHVGLDGDWPETASRWRTTIDNQWAWSKKRRYPPSNPPKHGSIIAYIDVTEVGLRDLQISMREDGAELDQIILTRSADYIPK